MNSRWRSCISNSNKFILFFAFALLNALSTFAGPSRTTYQAKIVKPNGYPLEASNVNFRFSVLDSVGSCVLYVEDYTAVNMAESGGLISFALGSGVRSFPASGTAQSFQNTFDNSVVSFSCQSPGIYNPGPSDTRKIVMQFNDGAGWQTLPSMSINAVPYAMYAAKSQDSQTLKGKSDTAFVENANIPICTSDKMLYFNGVSFSCVTYSAGSSGITSVTTSGSVLTTGGTASAPVISILAATMSQDGYLTSVDYAEFKSKLSASSTQIANALGYAPVSSAAVASQIDSSATTSATVNTIVKRDSSGNSSFLGVSANTASLNYVDLYKPSSSFNIRLQAPTSLSANYALSLPATSGTAGQVLSTDGAGNLSWINSATGSVTSVSGTANEITSTGGSTPVLGLANTGSVGTYFKVTTDSKGRVTSGATMLALSDLPASVLSTTSNFAGDISGMISNITVNRIQGVSVTVTALTTNDILQYDGGKYINKSIPTCSGSQYLTFNGTSFSCFADAGASGTITTLSVTSPISSTGGSNPTLSIAQATTSTDGYLSVTDFNTFNNKQNATSSAIIATLGYTPADSAASGTYLQKSNNLSDLTSAAAARTNLGLGSLALGSSVDLGSASATGIISEARLVTQLNITSGTQYTKITVDGKGRVTSATQLSSTDVTTALGYTPSNSASGVTSLNGLNTQTQTFAVGIAGTNFGINSVGSNHTFNIPLAASGSVAAGLLSNTDYVTFNNKQTATSAAIIATLGYTPADSAASGTYLQKSSNLSDLTNVSAARTNLGLGSLAVANAIDLASASATGTLAIARLPNFNGDATITAASNTIVFSNSGVTAGTYTKLTVDAKGRVTSSSALASGDVTTALGYTPANAASAGITTLNNSASAAQVFATANTGSTFGITTSNGIHTFTIPLAASSSVTAGLLSNSDYTTFTNKITSSAVSIAQVLGYVPAASGSAGVGTLLAANNLSDVASAAVSRNNLGLGLLATLNFVDLSGSQASGTLAIARLPAYIGDVTKAAASNTLVLSNSGVTAGTYTKLTVDSKGRVTSSSALSSSDVTTALGYTPANATSGVTSLNGLSTQTQTFSVGIAGTNFTINSAGSNHTFNIPLAASSSVLAGLLSNVDYTTFNNKITSSAVAITQVLGYTPADTAAAGNYLQKASNLSDLTNPSTARINLGLGSLALGNNIDLGSASATGTLAVARLPAFIGDATIAVASNTIILSNSGVSAGTFTKVTVDAKGRVTSSSAISSADVTTALGFTPANVTSATQWITNGANIYFNTGNIGVGIANPNAKLELASGSATVAPIKLTSGTLLGSAQSGTIEYDGAQLYFTDGLNTRRALATNSAAGSFDNTNLISNSSGNITLSPNNITGSVIINSSQASISSGTGALVVNGGVGINGSINASGNLNLTGAATIGQSLQISSLTSGSLLFAGASGVISQDNLRLFWDSLNRRLGIGTNSPAQTFSVSGTGTFSSSVGVGTSSPSTDALFEVSSTVKGFLPPRMTTAQRNAIVSATAGLVLYNTTLSQLEIYTGAAWSGVGNSIPAGAIMSFNSTTCPAGWTEYAAAYGRFLRGIDKSGTAIDPSGLRAPGNTQEDALQQHDHNMTSETPGLNNVVAFSDTNVDNTYASGGNVGSRGDVYIYVGDIRNGRAATETRGKNVAVLYCQYSGSGGGSGSSLLSGLSDVNITAVANGQILSYNSATSKWVNTAAPSAPWNVSGTTINYMSGNVGIGTTSPAHKLDVAGSGNFSTSSAGGIELSLGNSTMTSTNKRLRFVQDNASTVTRISNNGDSVNYMSFQMDTGNVGIGLLAPSVKLEVAGGITATSSSLAPHFIAGSSASGTSDYNYVLLATNDTGPKAVHFLNSSTRAADGGANTYTVRNDGGMLRLGHTSFQTQIEGSLFYFNTGSVGIGTATPAAKLDVSGNIISNYLTLRPEVPAAGEGGQLTLQGATGYNDAHVDIVNQVFRIHAAPNGEALTLNTTTGNQWIRGTLTQASDARLKKNIEPIQDSLRKISSLEGVTYNWINPLADSRKQIGLIAQDVEKVFPEAVAVSEKGWKSVAYQNLVAPIIEAIKELYNWLKQTNERVAQLEKENAAKDQQILQMKSYLCAKDPKAQFCQ